MCNKLTLFLRINSSEAGLLKTITLLLGIETCEFLQMKKKRQASIGEELLHRRSNINLSLSGGNLTLLNSVMFFFHFDFFGDELEENRTRFLKFVE